MPTHPYTTTKTPPSVGSSRPERAHARVRLPGHVEFGGHRYRLYDVSLGGFCFEANGLSPKPGETQRGSVTINADGVAVTVASSFQIRNYDGDNKRAGCAFQDLGKAETTALRNVINAHLAGDPINPADLGNPSPGVAPTYAARPAVSAQRMAPPPRQTNRMRALVTTAVFLGTAVVAFGYTARQINRAVFASTATAAKVAGPTYQVLMPREGTFYSLVPEDGIVKKGAPIASFEAPVLDLVRNQTLGANMTAEQLQKLMKVTVKGTITSPCDCKVQAQHVVEGQYVSREQPLFELMPRDFEPYLVARFRNDQLGDLAQGDRVSFRVSGESTSRMGKITQVRAHGRGDTVDTDVMVVIHPEEPLPADLLSRPAEVVAGGFPALPDFMPGTATAKDREP
jgi:alginate biosynthesis protein Alg44